MAKRGKQPRFNLHHRRPKSLGGSDDEDNLAYVSVLLHRSWHNLFSNCSPEQIAKIINDTWLDPDFVFVVERK